MELNEMSFMSACRNFFGVKEGQSNLEFGKEVKMLTKADRKDITDGLEMNGYKIMPAETGV